MNTQNGCEHTASHRSDRPLAALAERFASFQRISWRDALGMVAGAPFRIHHYRDVHTRMLYKALCDLDCRPKEEQDES